MKLRLPRTRLVLCAPLLLFLAGGTALAGAVFDAAVGMQIDEDTRIFLNVTNQVWHPAAPTTILQAAPYPLDDFPVIAFLAFHSHRSPSYILNLRREGYRWADIFVRFNVSPSVLFVGMDRDPGPPYGKAWGYWKQRPHPGARTRWRFSDRDIIGLVKVQTASRHFGLSPYRIIEGQRQGKRVEVFAANRWREKHGRKSWGETPGQSRARGKGQGKSSDEGSSPGKTKGKGHGHGKGKGR